MYRIYGCPRPPLERYGPDVAYGYVLGRRREMDGAMPEEGRGEGGERERRRDTQCGVEMEDERERDERGGAVTARERCTDAVAGPRVPVWCAHTTHGSISCAAQF